MEMKTLRPRIYIAVACHNRMEVAERCLPTLRAAVGNEDCLACYNDGSKEYDATWLRQWADRAIQCDVPIGIEEQRKRHIEDFWKSSCQLLYFTDHDCIHDPDCFEQAIRLQRKVHDAPLCLYNTAAHERLAGNTLKDDPAEEVIWRKYAPGVSYLLTRGHVRELLPYVKTLTAFDWDIPDILRNRFAVSRVGYIDHIGWGGQRHPPKEGLDGGDRVKNPTPFLVAKRAEVVAALAKLGIPQ